MGHRQAAVDHLEQGRLLAEEVFVRAGHDGDRLCERRLAGELVDGALHAVDFPTEALLDADVGSFRPNDFFGDQDALDHAVGIHAHQLPVLEGPGLSFSAVCDDEALPCL